MKIIDQYIYENIIVSLEPLLEASDRPLSPTMQRMIKDSNRFAKDKLAALKLSDALPYMYTELKKVSSDSFKTQNKKDKALSDVISKLSGLMTKLKIKIPSAKF